VKLCEGRISANLRDICETFKVVRVVFGRLAIASPHHGDGFALIDIAAVVALLVRERLLTCVVDDSDIFENGLEILRR
jgi:hypothetical protein